MGSLVNTLFSFILSKISFATESTKIMGESLHTSIMMARLVSTNEFDQMSPKEIKSKILKIRDNEVIKNIPMINESTRSDALCVFFGAKSPFRA